MLSNEQLEYWFNHTNDLNLNKSNVSIKTWIEASTTFLGGKHPLKQRIWHLIHDITLVVACKMCSNHVKWKTTTNQYAIYCSVKCASSDSSKVQKSQAWKQDAHKLAAASEKGLASRRRTNLTKYGHINYLASDAGKQAAILSKVEKYGSDFRTHEKIKRQYTMTRLYGCDSYCSTEAFQIKYKTSSLLKYGTPNHKQLKYIDVIDKTTDVDYLLDQHSNHKMSFVEISNNLLGMDPSTLITKIRKQYPEFKPHRYPTSVGEKQVSQFLTDNAVVCVVNDRTVIAPLELDIYLPDYNLAIEYCGLYWHSEQQGKHKRYHESKYKKCKELGIQLITLFEDEWLDRQDQVKRKLLHLTNQNKVKLFARNTTVVLLDTKRKVQFFDDNHIQGSGPGSITYGLVFGDLVVAGMSFIKQHNGEFVLNRYATSTTVVGGFGKLLKYFQQNNSWNTLVSFADLRWSVGNLYTTTGWVLDSILPPDYSYSPDGHKRYHKFNYRRKNLHTLLKNFNPELSETQNCNNNNVLRIWDCGKLRFKLINSQ